MDAPNVSCYCKQLEVADLQTTKYAGCPLHCNVLPEKNASAKWKSFQVPVIS